MVARSDYQLGRQIAQLLNQDGRNTVPDSRLINSLPDLLGNDSTLLAPLRDLMLRPGLRRLLQENQPGLLLSGRDSLLADLQLTYSDAVADRLLHVLNGLLQLPDTDAPPPSRWVSDPGPPPASGSVPPAAAPGATVTYTVQTPAPGQSGLTAAVIAVLSLVCGGALVGLVWLLMGQQVPVVRQTTPQANTPTPTTPTPPAPPPRQVEPPSTPSSPWGPPESYKFGQGPSSTYPNTCAFSQTDARGEQTLTDQSQLEFWACRDEGGNPDSGYGVTWGDGKRTVYRFSADGSGMVVGTNGNNVPMRWRNDSHNGQQIIAISHQDGATSWIPGHVGD